MKVLMLVNWKMEYKDAVPEDKQPPDYYVKGVPYWFFRYFKDTKDWDVDVVDCRSFGALERLEQEKIRFYIWQTIKCLPRLKRYDLVLSHGMQSGIVLCLWRRLFGKGTYRHVVFDIGAFNSARESGGSLRLMQFAGKSLDGVIYHTREQRGYYERCHPWLLDKIRYIPFGTDTDFFTPGAEKKAEGAPYILCLGHNKRDWETLLAAYALLRKRWDHIQRLPDLKLIGKGKIDAAIDGVTALPSVPVRRMMEEMENACFCVLPLQSFPYSFGQMTLLQQMLFQKAVIAADVPSLRDYVQDGQDALLYEPQNAAMLAEQMERLILDPMLCQQIGSRAAQSVRTKWNERRMAGEIQEYLTTVLQSS